MIIWKLACVKVVRKEISFEWSRDRILSTDLKIKFTVENSIIHFRSERGKMEEAKLFFIPEWMTWLSSHILFSQRTNKSLVLLGWIDRQTDK